MPNHQSTHSRLPSASPADELRKLRIGEGFLRRAMQAQEWLMLAGYVRALRADGVDVVPVYERVRIEHPAPPTLDELDRQVDEALAREETPVPNG